MGYVAVECCQAMKQQNKKTGSGEENKTHCNLSHCEVQGRGLCNSSLKKGATQHKDSVNGLRNFQPQPPLKAVPQAAGALFPAYSRNSFLPPSSEKLPVDGSLLSKQELLGASNILAPLIQVPKGIQNSGCRAKLLRIKKVKTLKRGKKTHCLSLAYFPHPPKIQ